MAVRITIDGYDIEYFEEGSGTPLLIVQGWGTDCEIYSGIANVLQSKYKVIRFNLPGFGSSTEPREVWTVNDFTNFTIAFIEALQLDKVSLLGHSFGGRVMIRLLNRDNLPFVVDKVIMTGAAGIKPEQSFLTKIKIGKYKVIKKLALSTLAGKIAPKQVEDWKSKQGSEDYRNASPIMRGCLVNAVNEDLTSYLPNIKQEVLLIWGEFDTATPLKDGRKMEALLPNAGLALIQGVGHYCFLENQVVFHNILCSYLKISDER